MGEIHCMAPLARSRRPVPSALRKKMPSALPVERVHDTRHVSKFARTAPLRGSSFRVSRVYWAPIVYRPSSRMTTWVSLAGCFQR